MQYHGASIHEEQVRIPLVVSFLPGIEGSRRIQAPVEVSDLRPTVMNLLDVRDESGGLDLLSRAPESIESSGGSAGLLLPKTLRRRTGGSSSPSEAF